MSSFVDDNEVRSQIFRSANRNAPLAGRHYIVENGAHERYAQTITITRSEVIADVLLVDGYFDGNVEDKATWVQSGWQEAVIEMRLAPYAGEPAAEVEDIMKISGSIDVIPAKREGRQSSLLAADVVLTRDRHGNELYVPSSDPQPQLRGVSRLASLLS